MTQDCNMAGMVTLHMSDNNAYAMYRLVSLFVNKAEFYPSLNEYIVMLADGSNMVANPKVYEQYRLLCIMLENLFINDQKQG